MLTRPLTLKLQGMEDFITMLALNRMRLWIERALKELGITLITANSPQAKGRVEVSFKLFQDRLIKEMRLAGIKDYDEANRFLLNKFLPWRNGKYTQGS